METKVQYIVEVAKSGSGGKEAAAELQAASVAANAVNSAATNTANSLNQLSNTGRNTATVFKTLGGVAAVAGFQQFPQLSAAAMLTKQTLDSVRASGAQLTANFSVVAGGIAGVVAALISARFAWQAYKAEQVEKATGQALNEQTIGFAKRLGDELKALREEGRITVETFEQLSRVLRSPSQGGNQQVRDFLTDLDRGSAGERLAQFKAEYDNFIARQQQMHPQTFDMTGDMDRVRFRFAAMRGVAMDEANQKLEQYNKLLEEGLITQQQFDQLSLEADTAKINRLNQLNAQLEATKIKMASLRDVEKDAITGFASGLAATLVDVRAWTKDAGAAFSQFFANLAQSIAQAIMQMLILRALKGAFPSFFAAADGGVFPRMMATGGIQTVSSATYFPRFNVVAGEAGAEMMAVLSRPRMMNLGGIEAAVGMAAGNRLAITSAEALAARGGSGGAMVIEVRHSAETEARIVSNSIEGAVVRVTRDTQRNTPLREAVRKA